VTHLEALQAVPHFSHAFVADSGRDATSLDEHSLPGTSSDELPLNTRTISVGARAVGLAFSRRGHRPAPLCVHPILLRTETTRGGRATGAVRITIPVFIFLVAIGASITELDGISMSVFCPRGVARVSDVKRRARSWGWDKQDKQLMWGGLRMAAGIASLVKLSMERTDRL